MGVALPQRDGFIENLLQVLCHFEISIGRYAPVDISADGVILSTPTGSPAYSLSAEGYYYSRLPSRSVNSNTPHSLASRALVFNDSEPVTVSSSHAGKISIR